MTRSSYVQKHMHDRKKYGQLDHYLHDKKLKYALDKLVLIISFIIPIMTLPQVYNIWFLHQAQGVSLITWGTYLCSSLIWLTYGIVHKDKYIVFANILWVMTDVFIVGGLLIFG